MKREEEKRGEAEVPSSFIRYYYRVAPWVGYMYIHNVYSIPSFFFTRVESSWYIRTILFSVCTPGEPRQHPDPDEEAKASESSGKSQWVMKWGSSIKLTLRCGISNRISTTIPPVVFTLFLFLSTLILVYVYFIFFWIFFSSDLLQPWRPWLLYSSRGGIYKRVARALDHFTNVLLPFREYFISLGKKRRTRGA